MKEVSQSSSWSLSPLQSLSSVLWNVVLVAGFTFVHTVVWFIMDKFVLDSNADTGDIIYYPSVSLFYASRFKEKDFDRRKRVCPSVTKAKKSPPEVSIPAPRPVSPESFLASRPASLHIFPRKPKFEI